MRQISLPHLRELSAAQHAPCISLYQPTHRKHPDNRQDPIRYRNLLRELESTLATKYAAEDHRTLLDKFQGLATDTAFWNHRTEGLAVLGSPNHFEVFELLHPTKEFLAVGESFHLKPLFRTLQSADRFQILVLDRSATKLYEGNRFALEQIELANGVPSTLEEALGEEVTEPFVNVGSYGGVSPRSGARGVPGMHHGHGDNRDEIQIDIERFFRIVAREIEQHHSNPSRLPLMLAALPEYHATFRKFSQNQYLMEEGLMFDPDSVSIDQLLAEAWKKIEPKYIERLSNIVDRYNLSASRGLATEDIEQIAEAAVTGRVDTLLVEADREIRGRIVGDRGEIEKGEAPQAGYDDLLDDLAEHTFRAEGEVIVVPTERMPSKTGAVAILRY